MYEYSQCDDDDYCYYYYYYYYYMSLLPVGYHFMLILPNSPFAAMDSTKRVFPTRSRIAWLLCPPCP